MIRFTRIGSERWVYWGTSEHEDDITGEPRLVRFWFRTDDEQPFWAGNGLRLRVRKRHALHVGTATQLETHEQVLGGKVLPFTPREVGEWGAQKEEADLPRGTE